MTFQSLKSSVIKKLKDLGQLDIEENMINFSDDQDFLYDDNDSIQIHLKNNDLIKVKKIEKSVMQATVEATVEESKLDHPVENDP